MSAHDHRRFRPVIRTLAELDGLPPEAVQSYSAVLDFVFTKQFRGACHAVTAILHVLWSIQKVSHERCVGELGARGVAFDHSWIVCREKVYDIAIALPNDETMDAGPVFAGVDLESMQPPVWRYGIESGLPPDRGRLIVDKSRSLVGYMDAAPFHRDGLWHFAAKIGQKAGVNLSSEQLRSRFVSNHSSGRS